MNNCDSITYRSCSTDGNLDAIACDVGRRLCASATILFFKASAFPSYRKAGSIAIAFVVREGGELRYTSDRLNDLTKMVCKNRESTDNFPLVLRRY